MFDTAAEVKDRADNVLARPCVYLWRDAETPTDVGNQLAWRGIVTADALGSLVGHRNRILLIGDDEYRVEDAIFHNALNYIEVRLLQVLSDG